MIKKIPYILSILTIFSGVTIAILFGVNEKFFKNKISNDLKLNNKIALISDLKLRTKKIETEKSKLWRYYQRFHFHATGIGAMSLALLIFLEFLKAPVNLKIITSYCISIGGFLYPFVWLFAAVFGPEMGRHESKEAFAFLGYMGGLFLIGILMTLYLTTRYKLDFK